MSSYKRLSPSCQQIIHEHLFSTTSNPSILIRSSLADPILQPAITNHKCNNVVLTPSGLYFDMALTVAKYVHSHTAPEMPTPGFNICDMEVHKPLIVRDLSLIDEMWIEMETIVLGEHDVKGNLKCAFNSITPAGGRLQTMGHCYVRYEDPSSWLRKWSHQTPVIQDRIDSLLTRAHKETSGEVRLVQKEMAYEMFESFVQYSGKYQNMAEVVFDSKTLEATSLLDFSGLDLRSEGVGPYLWDGSCHVSGFVCNAVEKDKGKNAFISNGVGNMRICCDDFGGGEVRNYVRMEVVPGGDKTVLQGNVFVLIGGVIVGVWEGVRFKRISRRVLNLVLPPA